MTKDEMMEMEIKEVQQIAAEVGVPAKSVKKATKEEIVDAILVVLAANPGEATEEEEQEDDEDAEDDAEEDAEEEPEPEPVRKAIQSAPIPPLPAPSKATPTPAEIRRAIAHLVKRGLQVMQLDDEEHSDGHHQWHFRFKNKEAAGTVYQPLRTIVQQASILMNPTKVPTEE